MGLEVWGYTTTRMDLDKSKGIYDKYWVERRNDPLAKHVDCNYFVLDLNHDKFAPDALAQYAAACAEEYPQLAEDLWNLISKS